MNKRVMLNPDETVKCPDCGHEYALHEGITQQTIDRFESEYEAALSKDRNIIKDSLKKEAEKEASKAFQAQLQELQEKLVESQEEKTKFQQQIQQTKEKAIADTRAELQSEAKLLQEELTSKNQKLAQFQEQELKLRQEKRQLEEARQEMELEIQRRLDEEKRLAEQKATEAFRLKEAEYKKKIDDAQKANEELKRKLEQGSQQLQGEVLELELEDTLKLAFPLDVISPVGKGTRGADVIQTVLLRSGTACGKILWETKHAKNWSNGWVQKLKDDQHAEGAEIAVLVSTAFPAGTNDPFIQIDGVWLIRPEVVRHIAEILRTILIESQKQKLISHGKNEKMEALFDYVCSAQFAQKLRGIVDAYQAMKDDLDREKAAIMKLWKKREGQLERITSNVIGLCGELQGVADDALPQLDTIGKLPAELDA